MTRKREIIIQKSESGKAVLNWISQRYTYHDSQKWSQYIVDGRVKVNCMDVGTDYILKENDRVIYYPEPIIEPPVNTNYKTVYEDEDLLVINKPQDLPCHPGGIYFENTLWYILKKKYEYISLINRLDRETSGIMLIAKTRESAKYYFNQMMDREIQKSYLVLVYGNFTGPTSAKGWLTPDKNSIIRKKRAFILDSEADQPVGEGDPEKQYACTLLKKIDNNSRFSLVECELLTGRTHQIRATLNSLGYPVVGDKIYGPDDSYFFKFINDELTSTEWEDLYLKNQGLHSYKTTLVHLNGKTMTFTAEKPDDWPL